MGSQSSLGSSGALKPTEVPSERDPFVSNTAASHPECRGAQTKTPLSFQNLEAALPPGMLQAADPVACEVRLMPELATISAIPAGSGRSAWRDREIWMQSEPRRPKTILVVCMRPRGEEGAKGRDSFMRTVRTCMSTQSLFPPVRRDRAAVTVEAKVKVSAIDSGQKKKKRACP